MTAQFQEIDDQNRNNHFSLDASDKCYYLYEYTSGKDYQFSTTNSLISNLKKKPSLANTPQYRYKRQAIKDCGIALGEALNPEWLAGGTLVPIPPSKAHGDPEYDDRISKICGSIPSDSPLDIREIVTQTKSLEADHETTGTRASVDDLLAVYQIDETKIDPPPKSIGVFDDVLTNGTHFRAMKAKLQARFPNVPIYGIFIARRVFPDPFEDFKDQPL